MKLSKKILLSISVFVLVIAMSTISFATYTSPYAEPTYLVKYGSRGTGVKWVQDLLKKNGYTIDVDGIFGTKTKNAVKHFQKYNNLSQDGIVGPATRNALKKSVAYLSNKQTGLPTFNRNRTDLIGIIQNCKKYYATNNFYYSLSNGVRSIPADKSKSYNGQYYTDCSNFVSWVLYEYALANGNTSMKNYFSYQRNSSTFASIGSSVKNSYFQKINSLSNAKAGDILVTSGHVEFLSSYTKNTNGTLNLKVYNCGSNASLKASGITTSATKYESEIKCILRVK